MAQTPLPSVPTSAQRYLDILIKRPQPGTIYERFYAAWLEERTAAELGDFLADKTKQPGASAADHLLLAVYQAHRGDDRAALAAYEAALKLDPGNAAAWVERSRLESRALDFATALKSLDEAAKAKPDAATAMEIGKLRGRALLRLGKNEEALKSWKDLAAAHAEDEDLAEEMIDLLTDEGQHEAALEAAQALVKRSRDPVAKTLRQLRLADILLLAERRDEALKTLREALAATGADTWIEGDVLGRLGRVFRMSDDVSGLEKFLAELVKENPQRVALAWQHTQLLGETGQKDAALQQARSLLQSNPGRRDLQEGFLDLLESLDLISEAVDQARVLVQQNAGDKETLVRLATLQHRAKDEAGARKTLEQFLAVKGAGEAEHLRVARLLENWEELPVKGKPADSQSPAALAYARLVATFPDSLGAQEAQAHYLHRTGQREAALVIWKRLAKSVGLEDLLRIAQALQARMESRTALDLLMPRERDFASEARFYALLVQLGIANKELERTLPWARARLRLAKDAEAIETAVKDLSLVLRGDEAASLRASVLQDLQKNTTLTIQDRCLLAALLEEGGKSAEAEKALSDAPEADRLIALSQLAQLFQTRQDWEKAAQTLQQVIALPEARTSARVQRIVDFYRRVSKPEEAIKWIAEWKRISPSAVQPWLDESRLLLELGRPKDALTLLRGGMRKFPDNFEVASSYATLCLENAQPDEAERTYLALYEKTTDTTARLRLLGPLALASQQHNGLPRLIENFQQRQKQNRASAQPWLALAKIHRSTGNDEERRRCLYEASRLRPQDIGLLQEIARSEEEVGLTAEALRTLEAAAKLDKTTKTREQIARLQIDGGDADAGYRMLFELAVGNQMDARGIEQMADTIAEKGEWERVISFLEPLLPKHPKDYRLHYLNAIALEEAGRERDAVRGFLTLLDLHEELPGVLSTGRSIGLRQQYASQHLPPGAEDWLVLPGMMQYAYAHRQKAAQGSRRNYGGGYYGQQVNNGMPHGFIEHAPGVTESPVLALAHLLQIAGGWDAQERSALVPQLKQAGVSDAALLLEAAENSPQLIITPEMLTAHPQNITLHAVWLMQHQQGDPEELLPVYENAWKLFQTSDTTQAQSIALRAWFIAGEKSGVWLTRLFDLVEKQTQPDAQAFQGIASLLQGQTAAVQGESQAAPRLTAAEIKRLADRLRAWYRAKPESYAATSLIAALVGAQEWEGLVEAIKLALEKPKDKAAATSVSVVQMGRRYRGGWSGSMIQPQPFYLLPGFPPELASLADQMCGRRNYRDEFGEAPELPEAVKERLKAMQDGLRPFIAKADEPRLRFMLQLMCGEDDVLEKSAVARLLAKDAIADDFLTAGWLAQRVNKSTEAIAHFTQALKLTTDANAKLMIENAILHHAQRFIQQEQDEAKTAPVRAQMKTLLEAHLQTAKSTDEKYQIAQLMSGVGLTEEAQAVEEAVRAAQNRMSTPARQRSTPVTNPYSNNRSYYQRQQQAQKTPEQLMQEGKRDLVVKDYVRQLRAAIQQTLSPQNSTSGHQQLHQVMDQAAKLSLWDEVAKAMRDSAEGGWRSRLEYAVMLEHVGNSSEPALAEHRAVIAANPRAYDAQLRLAVVLSYEGKFDEAVQHWRTVPAMLQEQHLQGIIQEFTQRHQYAVPKPEALSGLLCTWLRGLEANRPLPMRLVQQLVQALHSIEQADGDGPSLYQPWRPDPLSGDRQRWKLKTDGTLDLEEAAAKNRAIRRQAHDDLCRAMLAVPELAQSAFPPLAGLALEDGDAKAIAELETTALDLLTRLTMPKVKRRLVSTGYNNIYNSNDGVVFRGRSRIFMPDAALFLVRAAALRHDTHALDDTLYPLVTRVQGKPRAAYLKGYADLLMAKEDGFISAAESWLKQQQAYALNNEGGAHDEVLRLWLERKITAPLDALYAPKSATVYGYNIPHAVTACVMALGQRNPEAMRQFVRKLREQWLGMDAEARRKAVSGWITTQNDQRRRNSYYRQPGVKEQATNAYIQWLQNLLQQSRGLALLETAMEDGLDASPNWLNQIAYQHSGSERLRTLDDFMSCAEAVGFFNNATRFRAYDLHESGGSEHATWLGNHARRFRERCNDEQVNEAIAQLSQRTPTIGTELMQALLVKNTRTPMMLDGKPVPFEAAQIQRFQNRNEDGFAHRGAALALVLKRHAKELPTLSPQGQSELSELLREELRGYPKPERLGDELVGILSPLLKHENAELLTQADELLAAKTWDDLVKSRGQSAETFASQFGDVARVDLPKAEAAARHFVELLKNSPEQKQAERQHYRETPVYQFLQRLGQAPHLLRLTLVLAEEENLTNSRNWSSNLCYRIEESLNDPLNIPAAFTNTPWVAEAADFLDLEVQDSSEPTILARLIDHVENQKGVAAALRDHLAKQPATFGSELLLAFLHRGPGDDEYRRSFYNTQRPDDSVLRAFIQKRSTDFARLKPRPASCLLALLRARLPTLDAQLNEDAALRDSLHPLVKANEQQFESEVARWLKLTSLQEEGMQSDEAHRLLDRLAEADKARAIDFLDHVSRLLAAQEAEQYRRGGQSRAPDQTLVARWLQQTAGIPELFGEVLKRAEETGVTKNVSWLASTVSNMHNLYQYRGKPRRVVTLLESAGMLNPAATITFNPAPQPSHDQARMLFETWMPVFSDTRGHPGLVAELEKRQPRTFGTDLVLLLSKRPASDEVTAFALRHAEEIGTASPEQQAVLAQFFERMKWTETFAANVPALKDDFAPLFREREARGMAFADELLKTRNWQDIESLHQRSVSPNGRAMSPSGMRPQPFYSPGQSSPAVDYLAAQLTALAVTAPDKAAQGLLHLSGIYRAEFQQVNDPYRRPPVDKLLYGLCTVPRMVPAVFRFAAQNRSTTGSFNNQDWSEYTLIGRALPVAPTDSAEKLAASLDALGLLADAGTFDVISLPGFTTRSMLGLVLWRVMPLPEELREQTARLLIKNKDAKFGHHLFAALLTAAASPEKAKRLELCAAGFGQLRPQATGAILSAFEGQFPALVSTDKAEGDLALFAPLLQLRTTEERNYLDGVLAGKSNAPTPYRGYDLVVTLELARLMNAAKKEDALRLVQAMLRQFEPQSAAATFGMNSYQRDGEHLSSFLGSMFRHETADVPALFACLMQSAAHLPEVRVLPDSLTYSGLSETRGLLFDMWEQRGGWAAPSQVFDQLIKDIAGHGIEQTRGLWFPLMHHMLVRVGPPGRADLLKWATRQDQLGSKIVADEMRLAQSLLEATEPLLPAAGARVCDAKKTKKFESASKSAMGILRDETIAQHVRLALAAYFSAIFPGVLDENARQAWGLTAAQAWHDAKPVTRFELESLLNSASVLPSNDTWRQTSSLVLERWNEREAVFQKNKRRYSESWFHPFILRFAARSDDTATLDRLIGQSGENDAKRFSGILQECGAWTHAYKLNLLNYYDGSYYETDKPQGWLPPSETALKAMHALGDKTLLAEAMALSADDTITRILYPTATWPSRDERLGSMVKRLASTPLAGLGLERAPALVVLGRENPLAALALLPQYDFISKTLLPDSFGEGSTGQRWWADFLAVHAALKFAKGDSAVAEAAWKLVSAEGGSSSSSSSSAGRFRSTMFRCLMRCWSSGVARDPEKFLKLSVLTAAQKDEYDTGGPSKTSLNSCLGAWLSALKGEQIPSKLPSRPASIGNSKRTIGLLSSICGTGKSRLSFQQRLHLFAHVSGQTNLAEYESQIWPLLVYHGIFTVDELADKTAAFTECSKSLAPRHLENHAMFLRELGSIEAAERELEEGSKLLMAEFTKHAVLDAVVNKMQTSTDPAVAASVSMFPNTSPTSFSFVTNRYLLAYTELLIRLGRKEEARDSLARLNVKDKAVANHRRRDALLKLLPPTPAPAK